MYLPMYACAERSAEGRSAAGRSQRLPGGDQDGECEDEDEGEDEDEVASRVRAGDPASACSKCPFAYHTHTSPRDRRTPAAAI